MTEYASPYDDPAWYMTQEQYDAAMEAWIAALPANRNTMVAPPEFLWRRPPMRSLPGDEPAPETPPPTEPGPQPQPQPCWYADFGRRTTDGRAYLALGVAEIDGTEREERYHPATNTRLHALLERYLAETGDHD